MASPGDAEFAGIAESWSLRHLSSRATSAAFVPSADRSRADAQVFSLDARALPMAAFESEDMSSTGPDARATEPRLALAGRRRMTDGPAPFAPGRRPPFRVAGCSDVAVVAIADAGVSLAWAV